MCRVTYCIICKFVIGEVMLNARSKSNARMAWLKLIVVFDMKNGLIQVLFVNGKLFITGTVSNIVRILQVVVSGNMVTETCFSQ